MSNLPKSVIAALLLVAAVPVTAGDDWANFRRYEQADIEAAKLPADQRRVVFMGNSITENWNHAHPDFFTSHGFVPRGISGQTSYQFLLRFRDDVINIHPEIVVINAGTNDVAENNHVFSEDRTFGNIVSMVELAKANGIRPVLSTVLPSNRFPWRQEITDGSRKIISLNKRIKKYADENGIPFVDYYSPMVLDESGALNPAYSDDGVHPTPAGYDLMEKIVLEVLGKM